MAKRYANVKKATHPDGTVLDSRSELRRYCELILLVQAGAIADLTVHQKYALKSGDAPLLARSQGYPNGRKIHYIADFSYYDLERKMDVIEDVKMRSGHRPRVYKLKKSIMEAMGKPVTEVYA